MSGYLLYGSSLSPFSLKTRLLCQLAELPVRWLPEDGDAALNLKVQLRRLAVVRGVRSPTHPPLTTFDELPLVPFLFGPGGTTYWDSSAIGTWLHETRDARLLPGDPGVRWLCQLLDEYVDEFGLYLLHHHRWVTCASSTRAPEQLRHEYASLLPGAAGHIVVKRFVDRQVGRLPYLFSVAPDGFRIDGVVRSRQPPSRHEFPPTHAMLDEAFTRMLNALEIALHGREFLFGSRPTLADASLYGMLASQQQLDPEAADEIDRLAPSVRGWLDRLEGASTRPPLSHDEPTLASQESLRALVKEAGETFVPLMRQNARAHRALCKLAGGLRNERAFDRHRTLYRGQIAGHDFRSVVKTFQVSVWQTLQENWRQLPGNTRERLIEFSPGLEAVS